MTTADDRLEQIQVKLDLLSSKDEIRDCLYQINRGMDRRDEALMLSAFHPGAALRWGTEEPVPISQWIEVSRAVQVGQLRVQHLLGNILMEITGDLAVVESYEISHLTSGKDSPHDYVIASRYIDHFERRDGNWKIARRAKVIDWVRRTEAAEEPETVVPLRAALDRSDLSFSAFSVTSAAVEA